MSNSKADVYVGRPVRCVECRHWRKIRDEDFVTVTGRVWPGPHGECNAIRFSSQDKGAWLTNHLVPGDDLKAPYGVNTHVDQSLITRPGFGCSLGSVD